ncbi:hypothetical protein B0J18DRAFT_71458 [Chaetomium sp. MPI-SDFR-AT-0129]|nr:hypothetical protein B0J18DRAFT_71458 [Chaetomium sp. MPI-SDFR-AT-0129]
MKADWVGSFNGRGRWKDGRVMLGKMRERIASAQVLARPRGCGGRRRRLGHWCCWCPSSTVPTFFPVFFSTPAPSADPPDCGLSFSSVNAAAASSPSSLPPPERVLFTPIAPVPPVLAPIFQFFSFSRDRVPPLHPRSSSSFSGCPAYFDRPTTFFLAGALCCTGPSSFRPPAKARALGFFSGALGLSGTPRASFSQHNQPKARTKYDFPFLLARQTRPLCRVIEKGNGLLSTLFH